MRSKIMLMMLTAIIVAVFATGVGHAQPLNPSTARLCNGLPYLCEKGFDQVTFPGNHNSGTYTISDLSCFYRNQGKTITEQLEFGIRYFDIDLCLGFFDGALYSCHGGELGPLIQEMLDQFNDFLNLEENRNEVIVLTFGDQNPGLFWELYDLQLMLRTHLWRWVDTANGDLAIFDGVEAPGDSWPPLRELVNTNQRIVVFLRDPNPFLFFTNIGVLSERDFIFDTWKSRGCTSSCDGVVFDTYNKCLEAYLEAYGDPNELKLVLITVNCSSGLCLYDLARLCQEHLLDSLDECRCGLLYLPFNCLDPALGRIPNFITADWTQNYISTPNIVNVVKYFNQKILKEQDKALDISKKAASRIGFESQGIGKMISAGIEFNTQWLTDNELWEYREWQLGNDAGEDLDYLTYGKPICLRRKSNNDTYTYLRSHNGGLYQSGWCRADEAWMIERYDPDNPNPLGTEGLVQAGDSICLYSVKDSKYVRAYEGYLRLVDYCQSYVWSLLWTHDERWLVHAGWNDFDEDRVIDEGDNCPNTYNPEQKDTDGDGKGDACDRPTIVDFDGDVKTDIAVYRASTGMWWIVPSLGAPAYGVGWGGAGFTPVPGDYDGDGKTDVAVYELGTGMWWITPSLGAGAYGVGWGGSAFTPVPGYYDGDAKTDVAIYEPGTGMWWIVPSSGAPAYGVGWGGDSSDVPIIDR